jgi:deazaflavin-dependent oxidoreductase (nitroreductase family)
MPTTQDVLGWNEMVMADLRANDGTVTQGPMAGAQLLILTTTGAKSGLPRSRPLAFIRDGDAYVIVGSNGGQAMPPSWLENVLADPAVTVEVGGQTIAATAEVTEGDERRRLFDQVIAVMPGFGEYEQQVTNREIPVVKLHPAA